MAQDTGAAAAANRRSLVRLLLPYGLLALIILGWCAGWFWIRAKAETEMDKWLAREAAAGRTWTCADRSISGFPFRLELRCSTFSFARADGSFTLGPVTAVVQVYNPRHAILEAIGPFHVEQGDLKADVNWSSLAASFQGVSDGFTRASVVLKDPKGKVTGGEPGPIDFSAKELQLHARPTPGRFDSDGAVDVNLSVNQTSIAQLDAVSGNRAPADIALDTTIAQARILRTRRIDTELEKWRQAGGTLTVNQLSLVKGSQRLQAKGTAAIDQAHRPAGQFDLRAAGLDTLVGQVLGQQFGEERGALIGNFAGKILGGLQKKEKASTDQKVADGLIPLPQLRIADGRLKLGPFAIPNVVVPPLY